MCFFALTPSARFVSSVGRWPSIGLPRIRLLKLHRVHPLVIVTERSTVRSRNEALMITFLPLATTWFERSSSFMPWSIFFLTLLEDSTDQPLTQRTEGGGTTGHHSDEPRPVDSISFIPSLQSISSFERETQPLDSEPSSKTPHIECEPMMDHF